MISSQAIPTKITYMLGKTRSIIPLVATIFLDRVDQTPLTLYLFVYQLEHPSQHQYIMFTRCAEISYNKNVQPLSGTGTSSAWRSDILKRLPSSELAETIVYLYT